MKDFKKSLSVGIFLAGLFLVGFPAPAYVELVVAPTSDYVFYPGAPTPWVYNVMPSDHFALYILIATDETVETGGLDAYLNFDPDLVKVNSVPPCLPPLPDYPAPVVDDAGGLCDTWLPIICYNQGNNLLGKVSYVQQTGMTAKIIYPGMAYIGKLEFHCQGPGASLVYPGEDSLLWPGTMPGNLFTSYHGVMVSTQIPEPGTILLLGAGLIGLSHFVRLFPRLEKLKRNY